MIVSQAGWTGTKNPRGCDRETGSGFKSSQRATGCLVRFTPARRFSVRGNAGLDAQTLITTQDDRVRFQRRRTVVLFSRSLEPRIVASSRRRHACRGRSTTFRAAEQEDGPEEERLVLGTAAARRIGAGSAATGTGSERLGHQPEPEEVSP